MNKERKWSIFYLIAPAISVRYIVIIIIILLDSLSPSIYLWWITKYQGFWDHAPESPAPPLPYHLSQLLICQMHHFFILSI